MELCLATNNSHKLTEIRQIVGERCHILSLKDLGCYDDIPETQPTIEGNSLQKAEFVWQKYGISCLTDDTGLLIDALQGEPGVLSARYAGNHKSDADNISLLLQKLEEHSHRKAHFKTVLTYIYQGHIYQFEGRVDGEILKERRGEGGFGYDPVFLPAGQLATFAEMKAEQKNQLSHRGRAMQKWMEFLQYQSPTFGGQ